MRGKGKDMLKKGKSRLQSSPVLLSKKILKSQQVVEQMYCQFLPKKTALAWTGGKDSTLLLWIVRRYARNETLPLPFVLFIDEGDVFGEIWDFVKRLSSQWSFKYEVVRNSDILDKVEKLGDKLKVADLSERNQRELKRLGFKEKFFTFEPESLVGNHLMKTVPMNISIERMGLEALVTGIRWDEQGARAEETYFSPRRNPPHTRVHPLLHFKEIDVWSAIHQYNIPYVDLYQKGYRSLGAKSTTTKTDDKPAWQQDFKNIQEREGRAQDKEKIMRRLRDLGYM